MLPNKAVTQLEYAIKSKITPQMRMVARQEGLEPKEVCRKVASGVVVIPNNRLRKIKKPCGIGQGLKTKVNANIGTSSECARLKDEIKKLEVCISYGADTVMDLSTGGNLARIRKAILDKSTVPVGTVPIYEAAVLAMRRKGSVSKMTEEDIFSAIESQAIDGVDFFTVHCGVTQEVLASLKMGSRIIDAVSRGGVFLIEWMIDNKKENPLYENFDRVLEIARAYDVTLSLGDGMRPGAISDATDRVQIQELILLGQLARRASEFGVQVMIEGPGHVPIDQVQANVTLQKNLCQGRPFYVLGPVVTDVAPGYDHITAAIGGALAASAGADFLCYVTPSEHLRLPTMEDVREGVVAARIAAHAADLAKGIHGAADWDRSISIARKKRDWNAQIELALDPQRAKQLSRPLNPNPADACTMCGKFCSMKIIEKQLGVRS